MVDYLRLRSMLDMVAWSSWATELLLIVFHRVEPDALTKLSTVPKVWSLAATMVLYEPIVISKNSEKTLNWSRHYLTQEDNLDILCVLYSYPLEIKISIYSER